MASGRRWVRAGEEGYPLNDYLPLWGLWHRGWCYFSVIDKSGRLILGRKGTREEAELGRKQFLKEHKDLGPEYTVMRYDPSKREDLLEKRDCGDCGAKPGTLHQQGCDVERCRLCGGQAISCGCVYEVNGMDEGELESEHPDIYEQGPTEEMERKFDAHVETLGGRLPWTGIWPGTVECIEFGWYTRHVDGEDSPYWRRCHAEDEDAGPDLNRLYASCVWDVQAGRWRKP
jgi:hypothetical protein